MRVLPWVLDPDVPARAALPFARGVAELAIEAAVMVGWPIGWALAAQRFAERGEARAMMLLGESPAKTALAQWRIAWPLAGVLALASALGALDASAPGRMAQDLVSQARAACAAATTPRTYSVPFVDATWLCHPGSPPILYGSGPGALRSVAFSAKSATIAGDMRRIDLDDARFSSASMNANVHANHVVLHGMSPFTHASNVPPIERAIIAVLAAAIAAAAAVWACVTGRARGQLVAIAIAAAGPLAALGLMRALERAEAPAAWFLLTPIASAVFPAVLAMMKRGC
ncbi:MAG TPA: hypothetical protein VGH28_32555 [Polyangiaceae bacterium]